MPRDVADDTLLIKGGGDRESKLEVVNLDSLIALGSYKADIDR